MGSLLGPVADTIATQLGGAVTFSFYGVPYRAVDAVAGVFSGDYFVSKDEGSSMLHDHLLQRRIDCPATKFIVMGYSQGAHAAGDQLARDGSFITDRVASLVMFGDPRFNPEASYAWGSYDPRDHGLAGARSLSDFSSWSSRVISLCRHNDQICQGLGWGHNTDEHDQPRYVNDYADLVAGLMRKRLGISQPGKIPLDLAFVLDSTGSMGSSIEEVRESVSSVVDKLEEKGTDFRVGLVDYKDTDQGDPYAARKDLDMTQDISAFSSALAGLEVYGGGDTPEAVYSGLMGAFTELSWRGASRKAAILMGDAQAKDPEPITGFTRASVLSAAHAVASGSPPSSPPGGARTAAATSGAGGGTDDVAVYPLAVGSEPVASFQPLADGTGGELFNASDPSLVSEEIVEAVETAAAPVEVVLASPAPSRPDVEVSFAANADYAGGEIESYSWDFDGDDNVDATTATGRVSHIYPEPLESTITVTANADDGHHGIAAAPISISESAPIAASAPRNLTIASPVVHSLRVSWQPPANLGDGTLAAYQLLVEDATSGDVVAAAGLAASADRIDLGQLPAGKYVVTVAAITEAGPGAAASGQGVVSATAGPSGGAPAAVPARAAAPSVRAELRFKRVRRNDDGTLTVTLAASAGRLHVAAFSKTRQPALVAAADRVLDRPRTLNLTLAPRAKNRTKLHREGQLEVRLKAWLQPAEVAAPLRITRLSSFRLARSR